MPVKKHKVISYTNLPMQSPLLFSVIVWLVLDHVHASGWVCGVVWTLVALYWILWGFDFWTRDEVDVLGSKEN